jgi:hypothetical protein
MHMIEALSAEVARPIRKFVRTFALEFAARVRRRLSRPSLYEAKEIESIKRSVMGCNVWEAATR